MYEIFNLTPDKFGCVTLQVAQQLLSTFLDSNSDKNSQFHDLSREQEGCIRIEIILDRENFDIGQEPALAWLRSQRKNLAPKYFLRIPNEDLTLFAVGITHSIYLNRVHEAQNHTISSYNIPSDVPNTFRYIGVSFFHNAAPLSNDSKWNNFGQPQFILPLIELSCDKINQVNKLSVNMKWCSRQKSGGFQIFESFLKLKEDLKTYISCLSWRYDRFADLLKFPPPTEIIDVTSFSEWEWMVSEVLKQISSERVEKVVLARAVRLLLSHKIKGIDILTKLKDHSGYLFLFEPYSGTLFLGCTPEKLLRISEEVISTESLAGTRRRGKNDIEDEKIARELLNCEKDLLENSITFHKIMESLKDSGIKDIEASPCRVVKLKHLMHLQRKIKAKLPKKEGIMFDLIRNMHPTPAVCGYPQSKALELIKSLEKIDRGCYAGLLGILTSSSCDLGVGIRSALISNSSKSIDVFAGAGIVSGSQPLNEWCETGPDVKMRGFCSLFAKCSPTNTIKFYKELPNINSLHGSLIIEELIRNGIKLFVSCPGSRCTPLTVALAKRIAAEDIHFPIIDIDERGASFFAVNFAKATGNKSLCAVITTSGTAVANLLPGAIEADITCTPVIYLTADRPAECRNIGANQTIDQINVLRNYTRWFKDFPVPDDRTPLHALLSDISYGVYCASRNSLNSGPVHLNFMYKENLAPDNGTIRDSQIPLNSIWSDKCIDLPQFSRWLNSSGPYYSYLETKINLSNFHDIIDLLKTTNRGFIVVGSLNKVEDIEAVKRLSKILKWPIFADIASGLRGCNIPTKIDNCNILLSDSDIAESLLPDLILQLGFPLVSKALMQFICSMSSGRKGIPISKCILINSTVTRFDPHYSFTHIISCGVSEFVQVLDSPLHWKSLELIGNQCLLSHLVEMDKAVTMYLDEILVQNDLLTEPFIARCVSKYIKKDAALFLSNSMPCRDMDSFGSSKNGGLSNVAINRGACGIDGIFSSAFGFSFGVQRRLTLIIGDLASLHDLNGLNLLHQIRHPITIVCVNNGGGGIFDFLPISRHEDVYSPFFDTPHNLCFEGICKMFDVIYEKVSTGEAFRQSYVKSQESSSTNHRFIEAVTNRSENVQVHHTLNRKAIEAAMSTLFNFVHLSWSVKFPVCKLKSSGILFFLHGFMGSKSDFTKVEELAAAKSFICISCDITGHGNSSDTPDIFNMSILSKLLMKTLACLHLPSNLKIWIVGYSLGARIAMSLTNLFPNLFNNLILISGHTGFKSRELACLRWYEDLRVKHKLNDIIDENEYHEFLHNWYSSSVWANFSVRKPKEYDEMIKRRTTSNYEPRRLGEALICYSVSRQEDFSRIFHHTDALYIAGSLDSKYCDIANALSQEYKNVTTCILPGIGHNVLSEDSSQLWVAMENYLPSETFPLYEHESPIYIIDSIEINRFEMMLADPLLLSTCQLHKREGYHIRIRIKSKESRFAGIGEVCPLPGFHPETLEDVKMQLDEVQRCLIGKTVSSEILNLKSSLDVFSLFCIINLYSSVSFACCTALIHAVSRAQGMLIPVSVCLRTAGLSQFNSTIHLNDLVSRSESQVAEEYNSLISKKPTVKVKVGGRADSILDAERVNTIAVEFQFRVNIRLDANCAWTMHEANNFCSKLKPSTAAIIEYIEEPLKHASDISEFSRKNANFPFALDESLHNDQWKSINLKNCKAFVLKPGLTGNFHKLMELVDLATMNEIKVVVSSTFDGYVGISHLAILASVLSLDGVCHGLSTYQRFTKSDSRDSDLFRSAIYDKNMIDVIRCCELLDQWADS